MNEMILPAIVSYQRRWLWRAGLVSVLALVHYWWKADTPLTLLYVVLIVAYTEWETVNLLTDRDFYPADLFVDDWFPDRASLANKWTYAVIHLVWVTMAVYVLFWWM